MMMKIVILEPRRSRGSSSSYAYGKQQFASRVWKVPTKPRSLRKCNAKKQPYRCNAFIKKLKKLSFEEQKLVMENIKRNRDYSFLYPPSDLPKSSPQDNQNQAASCVTQ